VKEHEQRTAVETGLPFPSPTLVGCAIAVDRAYFMKLGAFDEGMRIWGGENIELGFRTWMCGGQVKTVTCSRVGHVFKVRFVYCLFAVTLGGACDEGGASPAGHQVTRFIAVGGRLAAAWSRLFVLKAEVTA